MTRLALTVIALSLSLATACGGRHVQVQSGPVADVTLTVANNMNEPVNIFVISAGNEMFIKQIAAGAAEQVVVRGIADGSIVDLKAVAASGRSTFRRENVMLRGNYAWTVP